MSFKNFILGLIAAFGLPCLFLVVIPSFAMDDKTVVRFDEDTDGNSEIFTPARPGYVSTGAQVYAQNGCYVCHSQVIRPTYAGSDVWRSDWAGQEKDADDNDTRRESIAMDYEGEKFAHIGLTRNGPDLSNVGHRIDAYAREAGISPQEWIFNKLVNPRGQYGVHWSTCPSQTQIFRKASPEAKSSELITSDSGKRYIADKGAVALAGYLSSLKRDYPVPFALNNSRDKKPAN